MSLAAGSEWLGIFCGSSYTDAGEFASYRTPRTQLLRLGAGEAVSWIVRVSDSPRSPLKQALKLQWKADKGSELSGLSVGGYRLRYYLQSWGLRGGVAAEELCWTQVGFDWLLHRLCPVHCQISTICMSSCCCCRLCIECCSLTALWVLHDVLRGFMFNLSSTIPLRVILQMGTARSCIVLHKLWLLCHGGLDVSLMPPLTAASIASLAHQVC
jgi:hypothetical protein